MLAFASEHIVKVIAVCTKNETNIWAKLEHNITVETWPSVLLMPSCVSCALGAVWTHAASGINKIVPLLQLLLHFLFYQPKEGYRCSAT